ncbi:MULTISPECIES: hypothetical protein [unclassified Mesorhizobium]|uniref:hypothetical protein n=1 Tax=unclassified Mesorhizobium TaxID=325217 RepID=UPI0013DEAEA1|nr:MULTISPECIES: hypothetical protein [unclassified Mesorhizobium]
MTEERKKLAVVAIWVIGAVVVGRLCGDAIFAFGGEELTTGAGLAYFGLLVLFMERSG